jgi:hypothetical protein
MEGAGAFEGNENLPAGGAAADKVRLGCVKQTVNLREGNADKFRGGFNWNPIVERRGGDVRLQNKSAIPAREQVGQYRQLDCGLNFTGAWHDSEEGDARDRETPGRNRKNRRGRRGMKFFQVNIHVR